MPSTSPTQFDVRLSPLSFPGSFWRRCKLHKIHQASTNAAGDLPGNPGSILK